MTSTSFFSRTLFRIALCLGALMMVLAAPGCIDRAHLVALRDDAQTVREQVAVEAQRLDQAAEDPDLTEDLRRATAEAASGLTSRLAELDAAIAALDRVLAAEQNPEELWRAVAGPIIPALPEPLRSPVLLLGALGVALARAAQLKRAAGSIARGIAKASEKDAEFRSVFDRHADTFRVVQTPTARRIVDEKVRPGFMMRLPV
jgi:hypothetical protein